MYYLQSLQDLGKSLELKSLVDDRCLRRLKTQTDVDLREFAHSQQFQMNARHEAYKRRQSTLAARRSTLKKSKREEVKIPCELREELNWQADSNKLAF